MQVASENNTAVAENIVDLQVFMFIPARHEKDPHRKNSNNSIPGT